MGVKNVKCFLFLGGISNLRYWFLGFLRDGVFVKWVKNKIVFNLEIFFGSVYSKFIVRG